MVPENLVKLVRTIRMQQAEMQNIEVKAAHKGCPTKLYDTLSSFSNQDNGGIIVFGLDGTQKFCIAGVYDLQDLQKKVKDQCLQMVPPVRAVFTIAEIDGKYVCSAEIPGLDISNRPCYYKGAGRLKGSFVRVGDADLHMTNYELYSLEAFRKHLHDDERPVERAGMNALDMEAVQQYVNEKKEGHPKFAQLEKDVIYDMLNISRQGMPTLAALMNFGIYPQGYFPQLGITAVVVPGLEIGDTNRQDIRFIDNKRIEGTLAVMAESLTEAENRYSGIPTMRREMKAQGLPEPVFENRRNEFVVIFYNEPVSSMSSDDEMHRDEDSILMFCKIPRSRQEITEFLGLKTSGYVVKRYITPLIQAGKLQMTVPDQPRSRYQKYIYVK